MRISGDKPSSVILSQTKWIQNLKMLARKSQKKKQAKAKGDGVINPQNGTISINFDTENFDALKTLRMNRSRPQNVATCVIGDSLVNQQ